MAEDHTKSELELLSIIEDEQVISQSALSKRLGIAAGLVNFLMKRAVNKGLLKVQKVPARRYAYYLTPKGFAEKARLVADYMNTSLKVFKSMRDDFDVVFREARARGAKRVVVVGTWDLAELALLASLDGEVEIAAIICAKTNRSNLGAIPVFTQLDQFEDVTDDVLFTVADIYQAQAQYDDLTARFGPERVLAPKTLHVVLQTLEETPKLAAGGRR